MSYCRWSSDTFRCDLYCYESANGGWTTHVSNRRHLVPPGWHSLDDLLLDAHDPGVQGKLEALWPIHNDIYALHDAIPVVPIDLPHAGETFSDATLPEFRARVVWLRTLGYSCPDHVLETIDAEMAEQGVVDDAEPLPLPPPQAPECWRRWRELHA